MENESKSIKAGRQLPLQKGLIREMRMQGSAQETRQREPAQRQRTVGSVKVWSVVE